MGLYFKIITLKYLVVGHDFSEYPYILNIACLYNNRYEGNEKDH